jgi:hypothetical protein
MERTAATGCVPTQKSVINTPFAVLLFGVLVAVLLCAVPALAQDEMPPHLRPTMWPDSRASTSTTSTSPTSS